MELSPTLQDLLIREAHLRAGREAITQALTEQLAELKRTEAAKPGMFAPKAQRDIHQKKIADINEVLAMLQKGIDQLDRVEPHIKRLLYEAGEDYLRNAHPAYVRALAIRESRADWQLCMRRFGEKVFAFTQALGNVRNMATSGYQQEQQVYSQAAVQAFLLAISHGRKVEDEIKFANKIAAAQEELLRETDMHAVALPKIREVSFSQWVALISNMALAEAQQQFDLLIAEAKALYEEGIPQLQQQTELAVSNQDTALVTFVERALDELRVMIRPYINPEETEKSVAESEEMLEQLGRNSVLGRLPGS